MTKGEVSDQPLEVFPAKAGTHLLTVAPVRNLGNWIPAFAGMTDKADGGAAAPMLLYFDPLSRT